MLFASDRQILRRYLSVLVVLLTRPYVENLPRSKDIRWTVLSGAVEPTRLLALVDLALVAVYPSAAGSA